MTGVCGGFLPFWGEVIFVFWLFLRQKGRERVQVYIEWFVVVVIFLKKSWSIVTNKLLRRSIGLDPKKPPQQQYVYF